MHYRAGLPGWKLAAKAGMTVKFLVRVYEDAETKSFWAESDDIDGLIVSGSSLTELRHEVESAAASLLDLSLNGSHPRAVAEMRFERLHVLTA